MATWARCNVTGVNTTTSDSPLSWNCTGLECKALANPDINGLGVLLSFFMTATMTVILAWLILGLGAAFREQRKEMSVLDRRFIFFIRHLLRLERTRRGGRLSEKWQITLQKLMLSLSDAHLLAGLAILIASETQACTITIYHYHTIVYLGWTSFTVHLITLSVARHYLRSNKTLLIWRLVLMFVLFTLLFAAICLTGSSSWPTSWGNSDTTTWFYFDSLAFLLWTPEHMKVWRPDAIFALVIISLAFVTRLLKLFKITSDFCRRYLRTVPEDFLKRRFQSIAAHKHLARSPLSRVWWTFSAWTIMAVYLYLRAVYDIFASMLVELLYLTICLTWAFSEIFSWQHQSLFSRYEGEWGFGQVLPLLLVVAPLFTIPELLEASRAEATSPTTPTKKEAHFFKIPNSSDPEVDVELQHLNPGSSPDPSHDDKSTKKVRPAETFWSDHYYTSSNPTTQSQVHTDIDVLDDIKMAYRSKAYNALVTLILITGVLLFWSIAWPKLMTHPDWSDSSKADTSAIIRSWYILTICLPIYMSPLLIWFLFMAPFSRVIRRSIR